jgi:hypothetical protein
MELTSISWSILQPPSFLKEHTTISRSLLPSQGTYYHHHHFSRNLLPPPSFLKEPTTISRNLLPPSFLKEPTVTISREEAHCHLSLKKKPTVISQGTYYHNLSQGAYYHFFSRRSPLTSLSRNLLPQFLKEPTTIISREEVH